MQHSHQTASSALHSLPTQCKPSWKINNDYSLYRKAYNVSVHWVCHVIVYPLTNEVVIFTFQKKICTTDCIGAKSLLTFFQVILSTRKCHRLKFRIPMIQESGTHIQTMGSSVWLTVCRVLWIILSIRKTSFIFYLEEMYSFICKAIVRMHWRSPFIKWKCVYSMERIVITVKQERALLETHMCGVLWPSSSCNHNIPSSKDRLQINIPAVLI